jgi:NitT/TauT family transport system substrate-binding protein
MKKGLIFTVGILAAALLFARGKTDTAKATEITVYGLKGPSGIGMVKMFEEGIDAPGYQAVFETLSQADLMAAKFIAGEAVVGVLPPNVPAKIVAGGKKLQIAAITGAGMLSLLTGDPAITKIEDLRGKYIAVSGQGAVPEFVFRKILTTHNLAPDTDVTLDFSLPYPEIAVSLITKRIQTALLPEPYATVARSERKDLRPVADIGAEWINAGGKANYPMTALVVDAEFAAQNPVFMRALLAAYQKSIEWVVANPAEAGTLAEKYDLGFSAPVVAESIPHSNFLFLNAREARPSIDALFQVFLEYAPGSIGGKMPDDTFYYQD